jgi:transcriptional regulator with XRE-family HTH domain
MIQASELFLEMKLKIQLSTLIKQRGVTITTLAKSTKIPAQTIHNWIAGSKPRDLDQVKSVADYFEVTLDFLVYGIKSEVSQSTEIEKHRDEINAGIFEVILRRTGKGGK